MKAPNIIQKVVFPKVENIDNIYVKSLKLFDFVMNYINDITNKIISKYSKEIQQVKIDEEELKFLLSSFLIGIINPYNPFIQINDEKIQNEIKDLIANKGFGEKFSIKTILSGSYPYLKNCPILNQVLFQIRDIIHIPFELAWDKKAETLGGEGWHSLREEFIKKLEEYFNMSLEELKKRIGKKLIRFSFDDLDEIIQPLVFAIKNFSAKLFS